MVLIIGGISLYRSFAMYEEKQTFDVLKGTIPDFSSDIELAIVKDGLPQDTIPNDKDYIVSISCNNNADGYWNYEEWAPVIINFNKTKTKCNVTFTSEKINDDKILAEFGIQETIQEENSGESGLYKVKHPKEEILFTFSRDLDATEKKNLLLTEYRYAGKNPNNYVTFNNEFAGWRIIGLVNTPEGQRIKLIKDKNMSSYAWDSSVGANNNYGVNEWSTSSIMKLLNKGYIGSNGSLYYNQEKGNCYNNLGGNTTPCDFSLKSDNPGLGEDAKEMIDMITWNIGGNGFMLDYNNIKTAEFYNLERSYNTGKICSTGTYCTDKVERMTTWKGEVGLMYPSDYGYATSGGNNTNRKACLDTILYNWQSLSDCFDNDWLKDSPNQYTMMSNALPTAAVDVFQISERGFVSTMNYLAFVNMNVYTPSGFRPTIYLKTTYKLSGDENTSGSKSNPYTIELK